MSGLKDYFRYALIFGGTIFFIACLYLLSLGPVVRYWGTWKTALGPTNSLSVRIYTNAAGVTTITPVLVGPVRTVRYPAWAEMVYRPAFGLAYGGGQPGGLRSAYHRYVNWWREQAVDKQMRAKQK